MSNNLTDNIKLHATTVKNVNNSAYNGLCYSEKKQLESLHATPSKWGKTYGAEMDNLQCQKNQHKNDMKEPFISKTKKHNSKVQYEESKQEIKTYNQTMRQRFADQHRENKKLIEQRAQQSKERRAQEIQLHSDWVNGKIKSTDLPDERGRTSSGLKKMQPESAPQ
ncbi:MAG: hypothetical protein ABI041_07440 [Bdellovibrionia bacterium]